MGEKIHSQSNNWEQTESGMMVPAEGVKTYIDTNDAIVTDSRRITPESVESGFAEAQEKARQPLGPEELASATGTLISKMEDALNEFHAERKAGNEVGTDQDASNMRVTAQALSRLKEMYSGQRDIDQNNGEPVEDYIDRMLATYRKQENVYHPADSAVDAKGYTGTKIYEFARMRKVHNALKEAPEKARATVLGEMPVIKGSDDVPYEQAMLGAMNYAEDIDPPRSEAIAA